VRTPRTQQPSQSRHLRLEVILRIRRQSRSRRQLLVEVDTLRIQQQSQSPRPLWEEEATLQTPQPSRSLRLLLEATLPTLRRSRSLRLLSEEVRLVAHTPRIRLPSQSHRLRWEEVTLPTQRPSQSRLRLERLRRLEVRILRTRRLRRGFQRSVLPLRRFPAPRTRRSLHSALAHLAARCRKTILPPRPLLAGSRPLQLPARLRQSSGPHRSALPPVQALLHLLRSAWCLQAATHFSLIRQLRVLRPRTPKSRHFHCRAVGPLLLPRHQALPRRSSPLLRSGSSRLVRATRVKRPSVLPSRPRLRNPTTELLFRPRLSKESCGLSFLTLTRPSSV